MKLKVIAAALVSVAVSAGAYAAGGSLGTIGNASFASGSIAPGAVISDVWTFSIAVGSSVAASVTNVEIFAGPFAINNILGFSATLDASPLTLTTVPFPGGAAQVLAAATSLLAGSHTLTIMGTAGDFGATYGGNIVATTVPEPETLAMMLAGLGALGFLARRRQND